MNRYTMFRTEDGTHYVGDLVANKLSQPLPRQKAVETLCLAFLNADISFPHDEIGAELVNAEPPTVDELNKASAVIQQWARDGGEPRTTIATHFKVQDGAGLTMTEMAILLNCLSKLLVAMDDEPGPLQSAVAFVMEVVERMYETVAKEMGATEPDENL